MGDQPAEIERGTDGHRDRKKTQEKQADEQLKGGKKNWSFSSFAAVPRKFCTNIATGR